jgi:citronellol/citronellal dehydrogenase
MLTFGIAAEFGECGIAFNCLWPKTIIKTAALAVIAGIDTNQCRTPEIVSDAAYAILTKEPTQLCCQFCIDEEILKAEGTTNFDKYAVNPEIEPIPDLFVD